MQSRKLVNCKRVERLYRPGQLQILPRRRKKILVSELQPLVRPGRPIEVRSMDFMLDREATGRSIKRLMIVDDSIHESVAILADHGIGGDHLTRIPDGICAQPGTPAVIHTDMKLFNGRLRSECRNELWFTSLAHARAMIEAWRRSYPTCRPGDPEIPSRIVRALAEEFGPRLSGRREPADLDRVGPDFWVREHCARARERQQPDGTAHRSVTRPPGRAPYRARPKRAPRPFGLASGKVSRQSCGYQCLRAHHLAKS